MSPAQKSGRQHQMHANAKQGQASALIQSACRPKRARNTFETSALKRHTFALPAALGPRSSRNLGMLIAINEAWQRHWLNQQATRQQEAAADLARSATRRSPLLVMPCRLYITMQPARPGSHQLAPCNTRQSEKVAKASIFAEASLAVDKHKHSKHQLKGHHSKANGCAQRLLVVLLQGICRALKQIRRLCVISRNQVAGNSLRLSHVLPGRKRIGSLTRPRSRGTWQVIAGATNLFLKADLL